MYVCLSILSMELYLICMCYMLLCHLFVACKPWMAMGYLMTLATVVWRCIPMYGTPHKHYREIRIGLMPLLSKLVHSGVVFEELNPPFLTLEVNLCSPPPPTRPGFTRCSCSFAFPSIALSFMNSTTLSQQIPSYITTDIPDQRIRPRAFVLHNGIIPRGVSVSPWNKWDQHRWP